MAHLTALEGRLTPQIREAVLSKLESVHFIRRRSSSPVRRLPLSAELLTVTLRYPQGRAEIFDLFGRSSSRDFYYSIPIMSEYVEGQL